MVQIFCSLTFTNTYRYTSTYVDTYTSQIYTKTFITPFI